ncbi:hypothetical protein PUR57_08340 [Streptomyces sp. JV176]|uniref:hypothetical protein n=1 Tax=Streptomyces sp. JV176 TaxID=858630 RepID=UPI002E77497A|nr:hypothetical protein [Streptomyces sp. JV176]MEE1798680.1 hypothetical protein [Streptomyces sp. JV176]
MITHSDEGPEFEPDDPLAVILRPSSDHLGPPPGRYEAIRRTAARRRLLRAAVGVGVSCAVVTLAVLPLSFSEEVAPTSPTVPLAPPPASTPPPTPNPSTTPSPSTGTTQPESPSAEPTAVPRSGGPPAPAEPTAIRPPVESSTAPRTADGVNPTQSSRF